MLRNYFKIAWRHLAKNKLHASINIVGLAIGLATCLLISVFVLDELSYDRFHQNADHIVRVVLRGSINGGEPLGEANVMPPVAPTLRASFPEIQRTLRLRDNGFPRLTYGEKTFREDRFAYADSTLFEVFTLPLLKGDPKTALVQPNSVVITQKTAQRYFGGADPMGKVLTLEGQTPFNVTGVMANVPRNSHFHFDLFASMASLPEATSTNWLQSNFFTYLLLREGTDARALESKLPHVVEEHMLPPLEKMLGASQAEIRQKGTQLGLFLQPLTDIHLRSDLKPQTELEPGGDIRYVYLFGAIALFVLLLACINFMNLSTAGATNRAKEVGIRKVLGSARGSLVNQFLAESALLTALSLVLAVGMVRFLLPLVNTLSGKELTLATEQAPIYLLSLLGLGILVSVLAGGYPAFFLSSFRPIAVLKGGTMATGTNRGRLRSGLVVFQFLVSICLIIGTAVVYQQLRFIQTIRLGYDKEQVLVLDGTGALGKNEDVFRRQLMRDSRVVNVSQSGYLPSDRYHTGLIAMQPDRSEAQLTRMAFFGIDERYLPTLGMKLVAGRNFSLDFPSDSTGVLINETAARLFGWTKNPIGRMLTHPSVREGDRTRLYRVIGVVRDFHFRSLHEQIAPAVMVLGDNSGALILKTRTDDLAGLLASLKTKWAAFQPGEPFEYSFLDESYQDSYAAERRTGAILALFAGLTIFVACLGLFGLATFTAEQRTKEIGVRKVLGASVASIVGLLSKEFLQLVFLALLLAAPVAWYAMSQWLQNFAYKITIGWWVFAGAGLLAMTTALLTVSVQAIRAARANPVESLRGD
jgi:putative ABC transport system permease protein